MVKKHSVKGVIDYPTRLVNRNSNHNLTMKKDYFLL